ncbi:MAG: hypothetical protein IPK16_22795 [Anaerolineales bacterium]|nr:hypothetical protein [Anaerolineales bacterium]
MIWQCQRGVQLVDELKQQGAADDVHARTGLALDPMFSASKMSWLLDNTPGADSAEQGELVSWHRG